MHHGGIRSGLTAETPPSFLSARRACGARRALQAMDVAGEPQEFFASFAGDVPFQHPQTADHCVLHVGDSKARLAPRHYWVDAPVVLDAAVAHFKAEGFDVFGATAYSAPDLWARKYGHAAPLEPQPLLLRSLPSTPSPTPTGGGGRSLPPPLGSRNAAPL